MKGSKKKWDAKLQLGLSLEEYLEAHPEERDGFEAKMRERKEAKARIKSDSQKKAWANPEYKDNLLAWHSDPDAKARHSAATSEVLRLPEVKERLRAAQKEVAQRPGRREHTSATTKAAMACPKLREYLSINIRKAFANPEIRSKMSANATLRANRPGAREKMSDAQKAALARPGVREKIRDGAKAAWAIPEVRERTIAAQKENQWCKCTIDNGKTTFDSITEAKLKLNLKNDRAVYSNPDFRYILPNGELITKEEKKARFGRKNPAKFLRDRD